MTFQCVSVFVKPVGFLWKIRGWMSFHSSSHPSPFWEVRFWNRLWIWIDQTNHSAGVGWESRWRFYQGTIWWFWDLRVRSSRLQYCLILNIEIVQIAILSWFIFRWFANYPVKSADCTECYCENILLYSIPSQRLLTTLSIRLWSICCIWNMFSYTRSWWQQLFLGRTKIGLLNCPITLPPDHLMEQNRNEIRLLVALMDSALYISMLVTVEASAQYLTVSIWSWKL